MDLEETSTPSDFLNQEPSKQEKNEVSSVQEPGVGEFSATRVAVWDSSTKDEFHRLTFCLILFFFRLPRCAPLGHLPHASIMAPWYLNLSYYHTLDAQGQQASIRVAALALQGLGSGK